MVIKKIKEFFRWFFSVGCPFRDKCEYYDDYSVTCQIGGGDYCGKYRELNK